MQIVTVSGAVIPLMGNFKPNIEDIAHSLSQINRYNGHTALPISVAQHSVLVSRDVPSNFAFQALMHDAHEVYTTDVPSPIKEVLNHIGNGAWDEFESRIAGVVRRYYGLPATVHSRVKESDTKMYRNEIGSLCSSPAKSAFMKLGVVPAYDIKIAPWSVDVAFANFIDRFMELSGRTI